MLKAEGVEEDSSAYSVIETNAVDLRNREGGT
jgi:hypothetical protein